MPSTQTELDNYLSNLLEISRFADYSPNGLQVQGKQSIKKIVTGVSACLLLIEEAIKLKADAILVHHGYFWKNEKETITGIKRERLKQLLKHDINLFAYHLPLDAHPVYGNNRQLAQQLDLTIEGPILEENKPSLVWKGALPKAMSGQQLSDVIQTVLNRKPLHISGNDQMINTIAWCTGGAQNYIDLAIAAKVDAYLTGEVSEKTVHIAKENQIHFYSAGHHATERYGIKALGEHLAQEFNLTHYFIDIDNPV